MANETPIPPEVTEQILILSQNLDAMYQAILADGLTAQLCHMAAATIEQTAGILRAHGDRIKADT